MTEGEFARRRSARAGLREPRMESPPVAPRDTPLRAEHEALGASFTDFGGWMMPVRYGSDLAEHISANQLLIVSAYDR